MRCKHPKLSILALKWLKIHFYQHLSEFPRNLVPLQIDEVKWTNQSKLLISEASSKSMLWRTICSNNELWNQLMRSHLNRYEEGVFSSWQDLIIVLKFVGSDKTLQATQTQTQFSHSSCRTSSGNSFSCPGSSPAETRWTMIGWARSSKVQTQSGKAAHLRWEQVSASQCKHSKNSV